MLTHKQQRVFDYIVRYIGEHGVAPSYDEIRRDLNLRSKSAVHRYVEALVDRKYLRKMPYRARALEVLRHPEEPNAAIMALETGQSSGERGGIPLCGYVTAGTPTVVWQDTLDSISVPERWIAPGHQHFALRVRGDSMIDAGISANDITVIRSQSTADNGDIVVALIDNDETTLKRLRRKGRSDTITLAPENSAYPEMTYPSDIIQVQGKLVGLLRHFE